MTQLHPPIISPLQQFSAKKHCAICGIGTQLINKQLALVNVVPNRMYVQVPLRIPCLFYTSTVLQNIETEIRELLPTSRSE